MIKTDNWQIGSWRECAKCGTVFTGPIIDQEYDDFCSLQCYGNACKVINIDALHVFRIRFRASEGEEIR